MVHQSRRNLSNQLQQKLCSAIENHEDQAVTELLSTALYSRSFLSGALEKAARCGNKFALQRLVYQGAEVTLPVRSDWRQPALHSAAYYGQPDCLQYLLKIGADPMVVDCYNMTALHYAATGVHQDPSRVDLCVRLILSHQLGSKQTLTPEQLLATPTDELMETRILDNYATLYNGIRMSHAAAESGLIWLLNLVERVAGEDQTHLPDALGWGLYYHALINSRMQFAVSLFNRGAPFIEQSYMGAVMSGAINWLLEVPVPPQIVHSPVLPQLAVGSPPRFEDGILYVDKLPISVLHHMQPNSNHPQSTILSSLCLACTKSEVVLQRYDPQCVPLPIQRLAREIPDSPSKAVDLQLVAIAAAIVPHITSPSVIPASIGSRPGCMDHTLSIDGHANIIELMKEEVDPLISAIHDSLPLLVTFLLGTFKFNSHRLRGIATEAIRVDSQFVIRTMMAQGQLTSHQLFEVNGETMCLPVYAARHGAMRVLAELMHFDFDEYSLTELFRRLIDMNDRVTKELDLAKRVCALLLAKDQLQPLLPDLSLDPLNATLVCQLCYEIVREQTVCAKLDEFIGMFRDFIDAETLYLDVVPGTARLPEPECPVLALK